MEGENIRILLFSTRLDYPFPLRTPLPLLPEGRWPAPAKTADPISGCMFVPLFFLQYFKGGE